MTVEKPKFFSSEYLRYREDGLPKEYLLEGASDEDKQEYESYFNAPRMALKFKNKYPEIRNPFCRWDGEIVEMELNDTVDTLDFQWYDPVAAGEGWVEEIPEGPGRDENIRRTTQILVNGRDLNDYFGQMETLGHTQADWIYSGLHRITEETVQRFGDEWELACCRDCAVPGCDYVGAVFWRDGDYEIWDCWYEYGDSTRKVFKFRYEDYMKALERIEDNRENI